MNKINQLASLLKQLNGGEKPSNLSADVRRFLAAVEPKDVVQAEKILLESGFTLEALRHLSRTYRDILGTQVANLRQKLPYNHILRTLFCEHEMTLCFLKDLDDVNEAIQQMDEISDVSSEFRRLGHISEHLAAASMHCEKEDYVIFPDLDKHGCYGLAKGMRTEHTYIRIALADLEKLIKGFGEFELGEFKVRLARVVQFLSSAMREHIFWEDHILYPVAMEIVEDEKIWDRMKHICDELGYCGLHVPRFR